MQATTPVLLESRGRWPGILDRWRRRHEAQVRLNGKPVQVEWSAAADAALQRRSVPLTVELELTFSCLVKKSVRVRDAMPNQGGVDVTERLRLVFRAVTSTACSMDEAERLGRQPTTALEGPVARRLAPRRVWIDHRRGTWQAAFWM